MSAFLKQFGVLILIGLVGFGVLVYGLWGEIMPEKTVVEIVKGGSKQTNSATSQQTNEIVVDVAGAVEKPGIYKLPSGSRIGDALVSAGGVSAKADREWIASTLNLAQEVKDGEKVYIPAIQQISESAGQVVGKPVSQQGKVNINNASLSELDGLSGIGEVRAKTIYDNRPYGNIAELVSKAKIPQSIYEKIKDSITVY